MSTMLEVRQDIVVSYMALIQIDHDYKYIMIMIQYMVIHSLYLQNIKKYLAELIHSKSFVTPLK